MTPVRPGPLTRALRRGTIGGCAAVLALSSLPAPTASACEDELSGLYGWWRDPEVETVEGDLFSYGRPGDVPFVGDWDGDGVDSMGVRRGNVFFLRNANSSGRAPVVAAFGRASDVPVVGDWDGDGIDSLGVRRGNVFYLRNSNTTGVAQLVAAFGRASDVPVVGDWDGDGIDSLGVRRGNVFYLRNSNSTGVADIAATFGRPGDVGVVGDWNVDGADTVGVLRGDQLLYKNSNRSGRASAQVTIPERGVVLWGRRASICRFGVGPFPREFRSFLAAQYPGRGYAAAVYDTRGGCAYVLSDRARASASVVKIEVLAGVLLQAQQEQRGLTPFERSRVDLMIRISSDAATNELIAHIGGRAGLRAVLAAFGLDNTTVELPFWGRTQTTPTDQLRLVRMLLLGDLGSPLDARYRQLAWQYLTNITPSQRWGISAGVPRSWTVAHKNGWASLSQFGFVTNSVGFVADPAGGGYAIAIFTVGHLGLTDGRQMVEAIARRVSSQLAS